MIVPGFPSALECVSVFAALFALDFVWSRYTRALNVSSAVIAANYAVAIILLGGFSIVSYTTNHWLLIPAAAGAWAGTWGSIKWP